MASATVAELLSTPAFVFLAEQVAAGVIPEAKAEAYKLRFAELYKASIASAEREKDSIQKTRELKAMVRDESIAVEKARIRRDQVEAASNAAEAERKRLTTGLAELEARAVSLQQEGNELRLREQELSEDVAKLKADNESAVTPVLASLTQDIADSKAEAARAAAQAEALLASKRELTGRLADLEKAVANAHSTAGALRTEFSRVKDEPGRAGKALESVRRATQGVNEETERLHAALGARELEMKEQEAAAEELRRVKDELEIKLARYRDELAGREEEVGRVEATLRAERTQYKDLLERRIELQTEDASAQASARIAENERDAASAAYERAKRELKRRQDLASAAVVAIPPLEAVVVERQLEVSRLAKEAKEAEVSQVTFRKDIDQLVASLLKEEGLEKRQREQLLELAESCKAVEAEKDQWHKEELLAVKQVAALKAQRDNKSREVTRLDESRKATIETSKMKELHLIDLTKQLADINGRLRQFAAMYEVVKTERNAFANSIQAASQSIAEMRERIKILHNEVDILKNESTAKDKALAKERQAHALASVQRDALRAEANKASVVYREKQSAVESQIMAIDKMNSIINNLEREMLALKKQYEAAVETRNYTGIQLIDRNDELCILYEKSNIHDKTLADGEKALRVMAEEIRSLKIIIGEHERQLHLARTHYPETPMWAERILELQKQLVQARRVTEKLCASLEAPGSKDRWVELGGEDPDLESLSARVSGLEMRVGTAREELLERELVLEEISGLAARLKASAAAATAVPAGAVGGAGAASAATAKPGSATAALTAVDPPALAAAKQATELQSKIKEMNRKMMAVVSELSMYQATAIKLASEATRAGETLSAAEAAAAKGLPPSVTAEQRWQSILKAMTQAPGAGAAKPDTTLLDGTVTTAEVRPNAYIPDGPGIGLPKPYGEFAPFKPQASGAGMRHFRNPEPKELEL